jgi:dTDP-glucose 4,6-dehydratase
MTGKVAVIGSNSFSGASFCEFALRQGADVIGISRSPNRTLSFLPYRWPATTPASPSTAWISITTSTR